MGFGDGGILGRARRGEIARPGAGSRSLWLSEFGTIVDEAGRSHVAIVVPNNTPPFRRPSVDAPLGHRSPSALVTEDAEGRLLRTLISDARDLLAETLHQMTHVREDGTRRWDQTVVEMFWYTQPVAELSVGAQSPIGTQPVVHGDFFVTYGRKFIHVGRSDRVEQILADMDRANLLDSSMHWNGDLDTLDADGFIAISLRENRDQHLLLVGGSDYGTYYAVAWFLREHGVRWCYPGDEGTVIPRTERFEVGIINRIDEPDYRNRSVSYIADGRVDDELLGLPKPVHTVTEVNDARNWLLRNRMRPTHERTTLFYRRGASHPENFSNWACSTLPLSRRALLRSEERIPTGHNLSRFFSPYQMSMDRLAGGGLRIDVAQDMFPDPAPRPVVEILDGRVPLNIVNFRAAERPALIAQLPRMRSRDPISCLVCPCAVEQVFNENDLPRPLPTRLLEAPSDPLRDAQIDGSIRDIFSFHFQRWFFRYIPRTVVRTHTRLSAPFEKWAPCLYDDPLPFVPQDLRWPAGQLRPFRMTVAVDLAVQLASSFQNGRMLGDSEFCEALAVDDTVRWCQCTACALSDGRCEVSGYLLFKGHVLVAAPARLDPLPRDPNFTLAPTALPSQALNVYRSLRVVALELDALTTLDRPGRSLARQTGLDFFAAPANEVPSNGRLTNAQLAAVDRMALRGVIYDFARSNSKTRRVLDLMNFTAEAMYSRETGGSAPPAEATLLTFHSYSEYTAPPIFEEDPSPGSGQENHFYQSGEVPNPRGPMVLHPVLTPLLSYSRDTWEYSEEADPARNSELARPFQRLRSTPEQFNQERWALIARQTGIYEYMYGAGFLSPRIYTRRLYNALRRGYEQTRSRVFVAEGLANMGFDAIKYYELAQMLWNLDVDPDVHRGEFCEALFGAHSVTAAAMYNYFHELEAFWARRPASERRLNPGNFNSYLGYGIVGRWGFPTQLDYLIRDENWRVLELNDARLPMNQLWNRLVSAYYASRGIVRKRVQFFRRAFGLVRELVFAYHPLAKAWSVLEEARLINAQGQSEAVLDREFFDPLQWVVAVGRGRELTGDMRVQSRITDAITQDATLRTRLQSALVALPQSFSGASFFRTDVRTPIHRYLTSNSAYGTANRDLAELGLNLGEIKPNGSIAKEFTRPNAVTSAYWLPDIDRYIDWWNADRVRYPGAQRTTQRQENDLSSLRRWNEGFLPTMIEDAGFGASFFWPLKRLNVAIALAVEAADAVAVGLRFLSNA